MVEYTVTLDSAFSSLADATRRDILSRVARSELSVSEIAQPYALTFAAVSKHLMVLEKAKLIIKRRQGKQQYVRLAPAAFKDVESYLQQYAEVLGSRIEALDNYLKEDSWEK